MKFYSKVIDKPHSIIEEVRDGFKVLKQTQLCVFKNGVLETEDPKIIEKLEKRKDLFRTDRPWIQKDNWRTTDKGIKLLEEGERLGIDCRHVREWYLEQKIEEAKTPKSRKPEAPTVNKKKLVGSKVSSQSKPTTKVVKIDYKELMKIAKDKGINGFGKKKKELEKILKGKGVI